MGTMKAKNALNASSLGILHYIKLRRVIIIIGVCSYDNRFFWSILWDQW